MSYPSDLTDAQWEKVEGFFARPDPRGARSKYPKRRIVEAILCRLREGCRRRALPHGFPPHDTVHGHWQRWQERGVWPRGRAGAQHPPARAKNSAGAGARRGAPSSTARA